MGRFILLTWPLAVTRLVLLAAPLVAALTTLSGETLAAACALLAWCVPLSQCLADAAPRDDGIGADLVVLGLVAVRTMQALQFGGQEASLDQVWLLPVCAGLLHLCMLHLDRDSAPGETPTRSYDRRWLALIAAVQATGAAGLAMTRFADDDLISVALVAADLLLGVLLLLLLRTWTGVGWHGGSWSVLAWLYLEACAIVLSADATELTVRVAVLVATGLLLVGAASSGEGTRVRRVAQGVVNVVQAAVDVVGSLVGTTLVFQLVVLVAGVVMATSLTDVWYRSHLDFPDSIASKARVGMSFIDGPARWVYEFTSDPDFQESIGIVLPEIGAIRGTIFRVVRSAYRPLKRAAAGADYDFVPSESFLSLVAMVPVAVVWFATVIQVFPHGAMFAQSQWFWGAGSAALMASMAVVHIASDTVVTAWKFGLEGSTLERTYTSVGWYAVVAQAAMVGACIGMFVVLAERTRSPPPPPRVATGARFSVRQKARDVIGFFQSPALVLTVLAAFLIAITAMSAGVAPIESVRFVRIDTGKPDWLVSTKVDKLTVLIARFILHLNPKVRLVIFLVAIRNYILKKLGCWGCICLADVKGFFEDVGDTLGFRRRLLAMHSQQQQQQQQHTNTSSHQRRIFNVLDDSRDFIDSLDNSCDAKCDGQRICLSDVVDDYMVKVSEMVLEGLMYAVDQAVQLIRKIVPQLDELIRIIEQLGEIDGYLDYDLLALPEVDVRLDLDFLSLSMPGFFGVPSMPRITVGTLATLLLLVAGAFLAYRIGVLLPVARGAARAVEISIISGIFAALAAAFVLAYGVREIVRGEGYDTAVEWKQSASVYGLALVLLLAALFMRVGETGLQLTKMQPPVRAGEKARLLPTKS